jgi:hypothetical protein
MPKQTKAQLVKSINEWLKFVREDTGIADIYDALGEYGDSIRAAGFTENEIYAAYRAQFN